MSVAVAKVDTLRLFRDRYSYTTPPGHRRQKNIIFVEICMVKLTS